MKRPSQIAAARVRALRKRHGWTQQQLAERLTELGVPVDRAAIAKIEVGKRRLQLDEAFVFAFALDVAPINFFLPLEDEDVQVASRTVASSETLRGWFVGERPLGGPDGGQDPRVFFSEVPADVFAFSAERISGLQLLRERREAESEGRLAVPPKEPREETDR
jgi:transcriptional regulator with XRE-family HTH domain